MKNRKGFTLLEVLISAMVITIGVLGVAALIPAAKYQMNEAVKADMSANCGRAALKTMVTMDWLREYEDGGSVFKCVNWSGPAGASSTPNSGVSAADYECSDDIQSNEYFYDHDRLLPFFDTALTGNFQWVGTIVKIGSTGWCEISAAVCYKRPQSEISVSVSSCTSSYGRLCVEGTVSGHTDTATLKAGDYIFLYNSSRGFWYKIINCTFEGSNSVDLDLSGPNWSPGSSGLKAKTPGNVAGVYSELVPITTK
ncbi:MAG: prepilin-type N-terminal cleavage/methylation domain-containing protein [Planctomycetia bacterium]|nr:prepilin-type N-terminal cleavage/methylation domain-containing protein [Planctomycetia bacterium]